MIEQISLTNFKCFKDTTIFPVSRINLLYGMNGRGKSTLLQSLLLFAQSVSGKNGITKLQLKGDLTNLGTFKDVKNYYVSDPHFCINVKDGEELLESSYGQDENPTLASLTDLKVNGTSYFNENSTADSVESKKTIGVIDKSSIRMLNTFEHIKYVSADRIGPREFMERRPIDSNLLGVKGENSFQVMETHGLDFQKQVRNLLDNVLGGASVRMETSSDKSIIQLYLDSVNGSEGFKPINVGFGYSYVLPVILALLLAEDGDVLIVENPEAHLHPAAQSRMAALMVEYAKKKNLQLFVETHSDHVINGLRIAVKSKTIDCHDVSILHFDRGNEAVKSPSFEHIKVDMRGNLSILPEDFLDEWTKQLLQLV